MNYETKRNVFGQLLNAYQNLIMKAIEIHDENYLENITTPWNIVYDAALPDDLPVIPKAVGEYLKTHRKDLLGEIFWKLGCKSSAFLDSNELYIVLNSDTFARAWVLGAWRVEETGEIVKLEEDK